MSKTPNANRGISVFHTTELLEPKCEAPQWIDDNPVQCLIWMIKEMSRNIKYVPQQERFYENSFNKVTKKCNNGDFSPEELEQLRSICVYEVGIGLQQPVEFNNTVHLTSGTAGSSIHRRHSGMEWIYNLTQEGNSLSRLSSISHGN